MADYEFSSEVKDVLGGVSVVAHATTKCITRGFDLQMYMVKTVRKCNLIKVTKENGILEVMFYQFNPKRRILNKLNVVEIQTLNELKDLLKEWF